MVRRSLVVVLFLASALGASTLTASAGGGGPAVINVTKVVTGDVPPGTTFTIEVTCDNDGIETVTPLVYDSTGGTQSVPGPFIGSCSAEETDDGGAITVTYACQIDDPGSQGEPSSCDGDRAVQIDSSSTVATITVTNAFPTTDIAPDDAEPDDAAPDAVTPAGVVAGSPSFTG